MNSNPPTKANPPAAPAAATGPAVASTRGRKSREELAVDFTRKHSRTVDAVESAVSRIEKLIAPAAASLPKDITVGIIGARIEAALASLTDKDIWEAVVAHERQRLEHLQQLSAKAKG